MSFQQPKYEPGQVVHYIGDLPHVTGEIVSLSYRPGEDDEPGKWWYKITAKALDISAEEVVHGFKHVAEDELEFPNDVAAAQSVEEPAPTASVELQDTMGNDSTRIEVKRGFGDGGDV